MNAIVEQANEKTKSNIHKQTNKQKKKCFRVKQVQPVFEGSCSCDSGLGGSSSYDHSL